MSHILVMKELAGLLGQVESVALLSAPPRYLLAFICTHKAGQVWYCCQCNRGVLQITVGC